MALNLEPVPENRAQKRMIGAIIAFIAAAGLLFCAVSRRWMAGDGVDAGFGPIGWSCENCRGLLAGDKSNAELSDAVNEYREMMRDRGVPNARIVKAPSKLFPIAGYLAGIFCVITAAMLVASAVFALRGQVPPRPPAVAILGLFLTLLAGMGFMAMNPLRDKGLSPVGPSWVFVVFGVAVVSGIVAAQILIKSSKPEPGDILV